MFHRLRAAAASALALCAFGCGGSGAATPAGGLLPPEAQPNIVVVMTDDQAIGSLRFMPAVRSQLGRHGMTFKQSFATTPLCCPSRATYLTGQYTHNHGVDTTGPPEGGYQALRGRGNLLPAWLQAAGYRTAHIGKYLNGYGIESAGSLPTEVPEGWDYWRSFVNHTDYQMYGYTLNRNGSLRDYGYGEDDYQTDVLAAEAQTFLERFGRDGPFFLSVAPVAPHSEGVFDEVPDAPRNPRPAPRHEGDLDDLKVPQPPGFATPVEDAPAAILRKIGRRSDHLSPGELEGAYLGRSESLFAVDDLVATVLDELKTIGELDDTYVFFTSDNGFMLGEHGLEGKTLPHEESARVPLLVSGPGIEPASASDDLVANIDLAPTLVDLTGAEPAREMDGESLVPLLQGGSSSRRAVLLEYSVGQEAFDAIRTSRWMFARYGTGGEELYDMRQDPHQLRNLSGLESTSETRARLGRRLTRLMACAGSSCP